MKHHRLHLIQSCWIEWPYFLLLARRLGAISRSLWWKVPPIHHHSWPPAESGILAVTGGVASQFQHLSGQIFQNNDNVNGHIPSQRLCIPLLLEISGDNTPHRKLQSRLHSPAHRLFPWSFSSLPVVLSLTLHFHYTQMPLITDAQMKCLCISEWNHEFKSCMQWYIAMEESLNSWKASIHTFELGTG